MGGVYANVLVTFTSLALAAVAFLMHSSCISYVQQLHFLCAEARTVPVGSNRPGIVISCPFSPKELVFVVCFII